MVNRYGDYRIDTGKVYLTGIVKAFNINLLSSLGLNDENSDI